MSDASLTERRQRTPGETLASALFFVALWLFWGVRFGDYLFTVQENSIFLFTWEYFSRWLQTPDGFLCYVTSFFIQFFYYPLLGGVIVAAFGVAVQRAIARILDWHGAAYVASFIPTCLFTVASTWPGYFIFIPFNVPLVFSGSIALLVSLGVLVLFRSVSSARCRLAFAFAWVIIGYLGFGCWATFACLFCAINELTLQAKNDGALKRACIWRGVALIAGAIVIPILIQQFWLFPRLKFFNIFTCGLIEDVRYDKDSLTSVFVYGFSALVPLYFMIVFLISRLLLRRTTNASVSRARKRVERGREKSDSKKANGQGPTLEELERADAKKRAKLMFELLILLGVATYSATFHTRSFFDCLASCRALGAADWNRILEIDSKYPYPLEHMTGLRNLALFKTGRLAEEAFSRPIAGEATLPVTVADNAKALEGKPYYKFKMKMFQLKRSTERSAYRSMCELSFCHWGLSNDGARISMDNLVATEDRSLSFFRTMAFAATINGEEDLARKYLTEISKTLFYKDWANVRLAYLKSADFYKGLRDFNTDAEYAKEKDLLRAEDNSRPSLAETAERYHVSPDELQRVADLTASAREMRPIRNGKSKQAHPHLTFLKDVVKLEDYDSSSLIRKEVILISALFQKNGDFFLAHVDDYLKLKGCEKGGAPKAIEQGYATWRFSKFREKWTECDYKFTQDTLTNMEGFIAYTQQTYNTSTVAAQATLRESCAGTYWGYAIDNSVFNQY